MFIRMGPMSIFELLVNTYWTFVVTSISWVTTHITTNTRLYTHTQEQVLAFKSIAYVRNTE